MTLADRQTAALTALRQRATTVGTRFPGETQPSGDLPDDPDRAEAYLAATRWLDTDNKENPLMTQTTHRHSPAFDDALMNAGHALKTPDPIQALVRVLMTFRDEYRAEVLADLSRTTTSPALPSPEDTADGDESPHVYLTAIRHQAGLAHDFTKAGRMAEALEHVEAIERLLAVYRRAVGA